MRAKAVDEQPPLKSAEAAFPEEMAGAGTARRGNHCKVVQFNVESFKIFIDSLTLTVYNPA